MNLQELPAKTLMMRQASSEWFGVSYLINLYRGCEHHCIYCDSRSQRYENDEFDTVLGYKEDALTKIQAELKSKRIVRVVGTGSMGDPYTPAEESLKLTRGMLSLLHKYRWPVHLQTKGDLIIRDVDLITQLAAQWRPLVGVSCCFTITTLDEKLSAVIEPGAPTPLRRLAALKAVSAAGAFAGVMIAPVLPFLEDTEENITSIVRAASDNGASYVLCTPSVTLRDRQRYYFYQHLKIHYPQLPDRYHHTYGLQEHCEVEEPEVLWRQFALACQKRGLLYQMRDVTARISDREEQLRWV